MTNLGTFLHYETQAFTRTALNPHNPRTAIAPLLVAPFSSPLLQTYPACHQPNHSQVSKPRPPLLHIRQLDTPTRTLPIILIPQGSPLPHTIHAMLPVPTVGSIHTTDPLHAQPLNTLSRMFRHISLLSPNVSNLWRLASFRVPIALLVGIHPVGFPTVEPSLAILTSHTGISTTWDCGLWF
jgi:hypothetical protein